MMKLQLSLAMCLVYFASMLSLAGCVTPGTTATVTSGQGGPDIGQAQAEAYNGPKARIAVARFKDKTDKGWWSGSIGDGMADQLTTALFNTNRFIVLERAALEDVLTEQDLGASGRVRADTAAEIGQIEGAELMVVAAVTEFQGGTSGASGSLGGGTAGLIGGLLGGFQKSHMAIDLRIIDSKTSRVLAATSVEGEATDVNLGGLLGGYGGAGALVGGLSGWKNTPTEKALRICIQKAVDFIVTKTPQTYYHYGAQPAAAPAPAPATSYQAPAGASSGEMVVVVPESLNVRSGPGENFSVVFSAKGGDRLSVLEKQDKWLRVKAQDGREGWTAGWLTSPVH
ncbi:MAG: SH3 domain-containing protein [Proteobacteria bacterium]|nr:SH3 domain-containing protein [Pseudomonadota bacterium]MBU4297057.1 SH3 domain-containing protein [Pseudomonadota bacterium]MCG2749938.1 SH3 domain-containing protein [Desulfobulbaceae bacterium]